jgi:hypothetical protein
MRLDEQVRVTVVTGPQWDRAKTHFTWIDPNTLTLNAVIANPNCGPESGDSPNTSKWLYKAVLKNNIQGIPDRDTSSVNCIDATSSLIIPFEEEWFSELNIGDTFELELIQILRSGYVRETIDTITNLTVPEKPSFKIDVTFQVPNHDNVEIKSDDGLIQLYRSPYTCKLDINSMYIFHIRTEGGLKRLADVRLHTTGKDTVECIGLDGGQIWCGRQEAPGIAISSDNIVTTYVGPEELTKNDVLSTIGARGFIPFTQLSPFTHEGGGWTRVEGTPEANYKKEWGNTSFEMFISGVKNNPPNTTDAISWRYNDGTTERACNTDSTPTTGACRLKPLATALLDTAINELYIGLPEALTARVVDTIPSEDISVEANTQFYCAIEVTNWSWASGQIRARIKATGEGADTWERSKDAVLSSMSNIAFNDVITMPGVKYQLDFYAEHYDNDSASWVIDDMKRVFIATKNTATLVIHKARDSSGAPFGTQEDAFILWDGNNCGLHPPAELIVGSGYYCDAAKLVETSLGRHIITVVKEGFQTARKEFEFIAGNTYEFSPVLATVGEVPPEVDMMDVSTFYAMIAAKDAPINTFCDEATKEGMCNCTGAGSQEQGIWCKNAGTTDVLEPMAVTLPLVVPLSSDEHPEKPSSFESGCGEYPTPDSTMEYIKEWWSIAIELAFKKFEIYVGSYEESKSFIPSVIRQIEVYDEVVVSTQEDDDYDTPYPRRVYFPLDPALTGGTMRVSDNKKVEVVLLTKGPDGHFGQPQTRIGPFRYLEEDWTIGRPPALLYRDWDEGGAVELEYWEDSNPPGRSDITFTKFYPEYTTTELPKAMLEDALSALPFMTEETYATLMLNQAVNASTGKGLSSVKVWWDDCYCGGYGSDWEELIGPGKTLGGKDCPVDFGVHTIRLKKDDYADFSTTIDFRQGITYSVAPKLTYTGEDVVEEPSTDAYLIINSVKDESGFNVHADIWLGEAGKAIVDTDKRSSTLNQVSIRFCDGCEFGKVKTKIGSTSNPLVYIMALKRSGYQNIIETFKSYPGNTFAKDYVFGDATYGAVAIADPSENPKSIYTNTGDNFIIRVVNTGNTDADCTVLVIFEGIDTEKEYIYDSESIHILEGEEAIATVPIIIPEDAIPEGQDIANYNIKTQVFM